MIWTDSLYNTTEVASNKLSSFLNILIQNTQILQLFTMNFIIEKIINIIKNAKLRGLGAETKRSN
jgi:hypothetical protein